MPRRQHEKVTVIGSYSSKNTLFYALNDTTVVGASVQYEVELYPPENTIALTDLIRMRWRPYGSGGRDKRIACLANQRKTGITIGYSLDNVLLEYNYGEWSSSDSRNQPKDVRSQYVAQKQVVFTTDDPLVFQFNNLDPDFDDWGALKEIYVRYQFERVVQQ